MITPRALEGSTHPAEFQVWLARREAPPLGYWIGIVLLWAGLFLPALGTLEFQGEEARRVLPAVTMLETGDYLQPYIGGEAYFSKPPLINWIVAASFSVFGVPNEWTARLPSAVAMLGLALALLALPKGFSARERLVAAVVFLTSFGLLEKGRLIEMEAIYVAMTGLATLLWWRGWVTRQGWSMWLPVGFLLGLAFLLKGPLHFVFFYGVVGGVALRECRILELFRPSHFAGLALAAAVMLAWTIPAASGAERSGELGASWIEQLGARFIADRDWANWGEELLLTLKDFAPWVLFFPFLVTRPPREAIARRRWQGLVLGLLASLGFLALLPGYNARYVLPLLPVFALLMGSAIAREELRRWARETWRYVLVVLNLLLGAVAWYGMVRLESVGWVAGLFGTFLVLDALTLVVLRGWFRTTPWLVAASACFFVLLSFTYATVVVPERKEREKLRPAAAEIAQRLPDSAVLQVFRPGYQSYLFYLTPPFEYVLEVDELRLEDGWALVEAGDLPLLADAGIKAEVVYEVSRRIPRDVRLVRLSTQP